MAVPTYDALMPAILQIMPRDEAASHAEICRRLQKLFGLRQEDVSEKLASGQTRLSNRAHWAEWYLKKSGYLENTKARGEFRLTQKAKDALSDSSKDALENKMEQARIFVQKKYRSQNSKAKSSPESLSENNASKLTPEEQIRTAFESYQKQLEDEVLDQLKRTDAFYFEEIVLKLMQRMGCGEGSITQKSRDGGVDGIVNEDVLGLGSIFLQAKRLNTNTVQEKEMRDFIGALTMAKVSKGVFITTSDFSAKAKSMAESFPHGKVRLIGGHRGYA